MALLGYPDGQPRSFPNCYSNVGLTTTSTSLGSTTNLSAGVAFGFNASRVKLTATVGTVYVSLASTSVVTTGDYPLTTGDGTQEWFGLGVGIAGLCVSGYNSTTATLRIGAWG